MRSGTASATPTPFVLCSEYFILDCGPQLLSVFGPLGSPVHCTPCVCAYIRACVLCECEYVHACMKEGNE